MHKINPDSAEIQKVDNLEANTFILLEEHTRNERELQGSTGLLAGQSDCILW